MEKKCPHCHRTVSDLRECELCKYVITADADRITITSHYYDKSKILSWSEKKGGMCSDTLYHYHKKCWDILFKKFCNVAIDEHNNVIVKQLENGNDCDKYLFEQMKKYK